MEKPFWTSKTLWVNALAIVAIVLQGQFGYDLSPELQVAFLALINIILRVVTKTEILWGKSKKPKVEV